MGSGHPEQRENGIGDECPDDAAFSLDNRPERKEGLIERALEPLGAQWSPRRRRRDGALA
jgi:hypothetical protein